MQKQQAAMLAFVAIMALAGVYILARSLAITGNDLIVTSINLTRRHLPADRM